MPDGRSEGQQVSKREQKKASSEVALTPEGWRSVFHFAFRNWLSRQLGVSILSRGKLNEIISDSTESQERQAEAADALFAKAVVQGTMEPDPKRFPDEGRVNVSEFGDETIFFLTTNLAKDYIYQQEIEKIAEKKGLLQPGLGEDIQKIPRPEFLVKTIMGVPSVRS